MPHCQSLPDRLLGNRLLAHLCTGWSLSFKLSDCGSSRFEYRRPLSEIAPLEACCTLLLPPWESHACFLTSALLFFCQGNITRPDAQSTPLYAAMSCKVPICLTACLQA